MAEVAKPAPEADQVLMKVLAASVNPADWHSLCAKPFFSRAALGSLRPKHQILGVDVAQARLVEATGAALARDVYPPTCTCRWSLA